MSEFLQGCAGFALPLGLHDGDDLDFFADAVSNPGEVLAQSVQIDFGPATVIFFHRQGENQGKCRGGGALTKVVSRR